MSGKKPSTAISFQIVRGFRGEMLYLASTHHGNGFRWIADKDQGMKFGDAQEALSVAERASREWGAKCAVVDNAKAPHVAERVQRIPVLIGPNKGCTCRYPHKVYGPHMIGCPIREAQS